MTDKIEAVAKGICCLGKCASPQYCVAMGDGETLRIAENAITAYEKALADEGMVILPREPTETMIQAMHEAAYFDEGYGYDTSIDNPADTYRAMITAATEGK